MVFIYGGLDFTPGIPDADSSSTKNVVKESTRDPGIFENIHEFTQYPADIQRRVNENVGFKKTHFIAFLVKPMTATKGQVLSL